MLSVVAARCAPSCTAVIATSATPLGLPGELRLAGLSQADLTEAVLVGTTGEPAAEAVGEAGARRALWVASRGLPGVALSLARELAGLAAIQDAVVHLALRAAPAAAFLWAGWPRRNRRWWPSPGRPPRPETPRRPSW
jgi:hypothetical protein